jgi:ABC-type transport system involved in cytochrome c biogenesis permease subunit
MKMLVAVLDSNFWLGIHVPNITLGYAACCVAGVLGHIYIIQGLVSPRAKARLDSTYKMLMLSLGLGLTLAFFGTMLGGIWADQSWGRFWGWDPKENGALMIVLWCALIFHARIAKLIGPLGVAVLSSILLLVVMWAWFGVNLLSVGLHSYGFASGAAAGFTAYFCAEVLFLALAAPIVLKKLRRA